MKGIVAAALAAWLVVSGCSVVPKRGEVVDGTAFERGEAAVIGDEAVRYYLAPSPDGPRPLLVVLQGSGCGALFAGQPGKLRATAGQDLIHKLAAGRFAVMVVEKPGVLSETPDKGGDGTAADCTPEFRRRHSLEGWTLAISKAIDTARRDDRVEPGAPVRLLGMSEGAVTAARLARERSDVSHVVYISGFGCDQWSDMLVVARRSEDAEVAVRATEKGLRQVAADPTSADRLFEGQTYLFWSTFGRACPADDLAHSAADVFVAYGTADEQIDANGVEAIPAARLAAGKSVSMRRIIGGSHVLNTPGTAPFANLVAVFGEALTWMEGQ